MRRSEEASSDGEGSERTCAVTRIRHAPEFMIRFVLDPEGIVTPDIRRRLPGRGVWVTATADKVAEAQKKNVFARGFSQPVKLPENLAQIVENSLEKDLLQSISMANKAGLVAAGMFQVEKALASWAPAALFHAADAGAEGVRKIAQALRRWGPQCDDIRVFKFLTSEQIGLALGRPSVVHAALRRGPATEALIARAQRLETFRGLVALPPGAEPDIPADPDVGREIGQGPGIENE